MKNNISALLEQLSSVLQEQHIALKIETEELETVYLKKVSNHQLFIHDNQETLKYLARGNDSTYKKLDEIPLSSIEDLCLTFQVSLLQLHPENRFFTIGTYASTDEAIKTGIQNVSNCIDAIFQLAMPTLL